MNRLIAIGDIHGEYKKLNSLLDKLKLQNNDTVVFLGDYIDRGKKSKDVVNRLLELSELCHCEFLMGNHEYYMLQTLKGNWSKEHYFIDGGEATVKSYGNFENILKIHGDFYKNLKYYYETKDYFFVHAGVRPDKTLAEQDSLDMLVIRTNFIDHKHLLKQKIIYGHTPFKTPYIEEDKIGINTGCGVYKNAPLTAFICNNETFIFSN